jgi:hypothetical protein
MIELVGGVVLAAVAAWWWRSMQVREQAIRVARSACQRFGVQFLDESVVLVGLTPRRDASGQWRLRRRYRFEFTRSGGERYSGYVTLFGRRIQQVHLDAVDGDAGIRLE